MKHKPDTFKLSVKYHRKKKKPQSRLADCVLLLHLQINYSWLHKTSHNKFCPED